MGLLRGGVRLLLLQLAPQAHAWAVPRRRTPTGPRQARALRPGAPGYLHSSGRKPRCAFSAPRIAAAHGQRPEEGLVLVVRTAPPLRAGCTEEGRRAWRGTRATARTGAGAPSTLRSEGRLSTGIVCAPCGQLRALGAAHRATGRTSISIRIAARAVLVCCAGKGLQESHLHLIGCTLKHGRFWGIISLIESHSPGHLHQRSGVREVAHARRRGHLAKCLAAVAVCGGVQKCNLAARVGYARPGGWGRAHLTPAIRPRLATECRYI